MAIDITEFDNVGDIPLEECFQFPHVRPLRTRPPSERFGFHPNVTGFVQWIKHWTDQTLDDWGLGQLADSGIFRFDSEVNHETNWSFETWSDPNKFDPEDFIRKSPGFSIRYPNMGRVPYVSALFNADIFVYRSDNPINKEKLYEYIRDGRIVAPQLMNGRQRMDPHAIKVELGSLPIGILRSMGCINEDRYFINGYSPTDRVFFIRKAKPQPCIPNEVVFGGGNGLGLRCLSAFNSQAG